MKTAARKLLLACAALSAFASYAIAADLPPNMPPPRAPPVLVPFFSWNGLYTGINAGYGFGRTSWSDNVTGVSTGNFTASGGLIGGTLGFNIQQSALVFGVETDLVWSFMKGSTNTNCLGNCTTSNTWLGTTRGRIGYAFDRFLPYFTGGAAYGSIKISNDFGSSASTTKVGWTVGGGLEYAFLNNWSVKGEYLYANLGKATCDTNCSGGNPFDVKFYTHIVRAGLNYKF